MKKLLLLLLICACISCKSRKLSKSSETLEDKTRTEQISQVKQESQSTSDRKETTESQISDQSGTWIWEEWYQKDSDADTLISKLPALVYKRTTFVKNDITKVEKQEVSDVETHTEVRDSTAIQTIQNDTKSKSERKELDAKKESSWVWPLIGIILIITALAFVFRRGYLR